jgi:predicted secreted Zn-dependent protease
MTLEGITLDLETRDLFWKTVKACLIRFHGHHADYAKSKTHNLRQEIESTKSRNHFYSNEPFIIACNLAGITSIHQRDKFHEENCKEYRKLFYAINNFA